MRIAIANRSPAAIDLIRLVLRGVPEHRVIWEAVDGAAAVAKCAADTPDVLLLDMALPGVSGVDVTRRIMEASPCRILIVTGAVKDNASRIFEAMRWGAIDVVGTPVMEGGSLKGEKELLQKMGVVQKLVGKGREAPAEASRPISPRSVPLIAIGSSTGGPKALATILKGLPRDFRGAVVVIQHIDASFTTGLVDWLSGQSQLGIAVARAGDGIARGQVLVAQGPDDLVMTRERVLAYSNEDSRAPYHPSINRFFESCAAHWGHPGIAVLLSGMGKDGVAGMLSLRRVGWITMAQDEATSVIYGMPKAAAKEKAASQVLPVGDLAPAILERVRRGGD